MPKFLSLFACVLVADAFRPTLPGADLRAPQPAPPRVEKAADYAHRDLAGFAVRINRAFVNQEAALLERVLLHLAADLDEVAAMIPGDALAALRERCTIWIELQGTRDAGRGGRGLCCHWSPSWLVDHGLLAEKAGGVEIINPADFLAWRRDQPYMLFHELAHAYHWQLVGRDAEIDAVYAEAISAERYAAVARNALAGGATTRAYAATNSHEYFAELSEAYFALNDFYPYTRPQLLDHDPSGAALIERIWNLDSASIQAARGRRD